MPSNEKLQTIEFPMGGLNLLTEFQEQPPGTTADCENVRSTNPDSLRERGGSRSGIIRWSPYRIPANTDLSMVIQHLNIIVDPQAAALGQNFFVPDEDWVEVPGAPGTFVPDGGWGYPAGAVTRFSGGAVLEAVAEIEAEGTNGEDDVMTINVSFIDDFAGSVTTVTVTHVNNADPRTGSSSYIFADVADPGFGGFNDIECDNDVGVYHASDATLDGLSQGAGGSGSNYTVNVPFVAATTAEIVFTISNG